MYEHCLVFHSLDYLARYPRGIGRYSQQDVELSNKVDISVQTQHTKLTFGLSKAKDQAGAAESEKMKQMGAFVNCNKATKNEQRSQVISYYKKSALASYIYYHFNIQMPMDFRNVDTKIVQRNKGSRKKRAYVKKGRKSKSEREKEKKEKKEKEEKEKEEKEKEKEREKEKEKRKGKEKRKRKGKRKVSESESESGSESERESESESESESENFSESENLEHGALDDFEENMVDEEGRTRWH